VPGRVYITQPIPEPGPSLVREAASAVEINPEDRVLSTEELKTRVSGRDAVLCLLTDPIDASVLEAAKGCRVFSNMAVGFNNIDVAAATKLGIVVTNTPGVLTECTADLTWTLILGVARRAAEGDREMRAGRFPGWGPMYMLGGDVTGRTLGLVGPGRIATAVAERGQRVPDAGALCRPTSERGARSARRARRLARRLACRERLRQPARAPHARDATPDRFGATRADEANVLSYQHRARSSHR